MAEVFLLGPSLYSRGQKIRGVSSSAMSIHLLRKVSSFRFDLFLPFCLNIGVFVLWQMHFQTSMKLNLYRPSMIIASFMRNGLKIMTYILL